MGDKKSFSVGYGKPPREHAFRKGKSGNPLGAPRKQAKQKTVGVDQLILESASKVLSVRDETGTRSVSAIAIIAQKLMKRGIEGDAKAAKDFIAIARIAEQSTRKYREKLFDAAVEYKELGAVSCERHAECGTTATFPIDPLDILLDFESRGVRLSPRALNTSIHSRVALADDWSMLQEQSKALSALVHEFPDNKFVMRDLQRTEALSLRIKNALGL